MCYVNIHPMVVQLQFKFTAILWPMNLPGGLSAQSTNNQITKTHFSNLSLFHSLIWWFKHKNMRISVHEKRLIFMHQWFICQRGAHQNVSVINLITQNMILLDRTSSLASSFHLSDWSSGNGPGDYYSDIIHHFKSLKFQHEYRWGEPVCNRSQMRQVVTGMQYTAKKKNCHLVTTNLMVLTALWNNLNLTNLLSSKNKSSQHLLGFIWTWSTTVFSF